MCCCCRCWSWERCTIRCDAQRWAFNFRMHFLLLLHTISCNHHRPKICCCLLTWLVNLVLSKATTSLASYYDNNANNNVKRVTYIDRLVDCVYAVDGICNIIFHHYFLLKISLNLWPGFIANIPFFWIPFQKDSSSLIYKLLCEKACGLIVNLEYM